MITDCTFSHDEGHDFTRDFTVSIDQGYVTLFTAKDETSTGKLQEKMHCERSQSFALTTSPPKPRTEHIKRVTEKYYLKAEYSPVKRFPSDQKYDTIGGFRAVRLSAGPGLHKTLK